jgi:hypothetical protein
VALLRADDTTIARCQFAKAGEAVALIKTFFGQPPAGDALDLTRKSHAQRVTQTVVKTKASLLWKNGVTNRIRELSAHFSEAA